VENFWVLLVEPEETDRRLVELATKSILSQADLVFVESFDQFVPAISGRGSLPALAIVDWHAGGENPASCLDTLERLGLLAHIPVIATARKEPVRALTESSAAGVTRFVSKRPDDFCFRKKLTEAIAECVPREKRIASAAA